MSFTNRILRIAASSAALLGLCLTGCGSGSNSTSQPPTPPSITSQPSNQSVGSGQTATFSVGASGTAPLSYQWKKGSSAISGANSSSYTTPAATAGDNGSQFSVTVSNSAGTATSNPATLTINAPLSISTQPANQTVAVGQTATFSVVASGTGTLSYQWQKGGNNISGATSASYTTPATTASDNGSQFTVVVSDADGNVTSNPATLTVNSPPSITTQPVNQTVTAGQTATFSVVASGASTLSYQWQKGGSNISGATSASYTTPATTPSDDGSQFTVVVSDAGGNVTSNAATLTVNSPPSITTQPANQSAVAGQTATFSVVAAGTAPLSYQWQKATVNISGATSSSYTTPATTLTDNGSQFDVVVSNSLGNATSNAVTLTVTATAPAVDVLTYQYDNTRAGANLQEMTLTPSNVNSTTFGKIGFYSPVDGLVDGQPLYVSKLTIPSGGTHNVLYVVTEHASVYAFDADTGTTLWQTSLLGASETTSDARSCDQVAPEIGITSTPVIDRTRGAHGAIYTVAMSKDTSGNYYQRLHALDIVTGAELFGGPVVVQATYPGTGDGSTNGNVIFDAKQYKERAGLLLLNGVVYTTWASHCDIRPYTGWIIGYDESSLVRTQVLNVTPNGYDGAIWMAGAAPAADVTGNIYFLDANGTFDTALDNGFPSQGDFGNAFIKLSTSPTLSVSDYFTMANTVSESSIDEDLGSGGAMVLADITYQGQTHQLAVGAGKDKVIYVVDRTAMGGFNSGADNIYQEISGALNGGVFSKPAFFNNTIYYGSLGDTLRAFPITGAKLATTAAFQTSNTFKYPGTTPSISANGSSNAIVWAVENATTAVLHAYNASTLTELYNSTQAANQRDDFGAGNKFIVPIIVNGKVFVGTPNGVAVFGLLP